MHGLEFVRPVVAQMIQNDPAERPLIDKALEHFEQPCALLPQRVLCSCVVYRDDFWAGKLYRGCRHVFRTVFWMATGTPTLPTPHRAN